MIRYLLNSEINYSLWDECVENASNRMIYALSWYLDIVSPGWHAIVKEEQSSYVVVMPLPIKHKWGVPYVYKPLFSQQSGVFYTTKLSFEEWRELEDLLKRRVKFISKYEFNVGNVEVIDGLLNNFNKNILYTYHIPLALGYKKIVSRYSKSRRWRINKAKRSNLVVQTSNDLTTFLSIFNENVAPKIYGMLGEAYEYKVLYQLYQKAESRGMVRMYEAVDEQNKVQASAIFFYFKNKLTFILNSSTQEGKSLGGVSLIIDYVLNKYANRDIIFDFESPEKVEGLAEFFSSFGAEKHSFLSVAYDDLPMPIKFLKQFRRELYRLIK